MANRKTKKRKFYALLQNKKTSCEYFLEIKGKHSRAFAVSKATLASGDHSRVLLVVAKNSHFYNSSNDRFYQLDALIFQNKIRVI
jgi:hypothetical protein